MESFYQALLNFGDLRFVLMIFIAVVVGLFVGILPGISGLLALALLLPIVFVMPPRDGLTLLLGMGSVQFIGGGITAILVNVPGEPPSAATCLDGYPLAKMGKAGRAIGAAVMSSMTGGVLSGFLALLTIPLILPIIMSVRTGDMVFIILVGLTFLAALSQGSTIKGMISGGLGLLISFIGFQIATGIPRFTFGSLYLYDGIDVIPIALGMFGGPEMIEIMMAGTSIAKKSEKIEGLRDIWEGCKEPFRHWWLWLRSAAIGYIVGIIPGIGAEVATWVSYGQAKATSKHPETFGKGNIEGVIAPQAADNAKEGGDLITTLALGIPGSAAMALIIGALLMLGIKPGPEMLSTHLDLTFTWMFVIIVANIMAGIIVIFTAKYLVKISYVPGHILAPLVLVFVFIGAFAENEEIIDLVLCVIFTIIGLAFKRFGYNRPALFLGFILGVLFEEYFFKALGVAGPFFFLTPISLVMIAMAIFLLTFGRLKKMAHRKGEVELSIKGDDD